MRTGLTVFLLASLVVMTSGTTAARTETASAQTEVDAVQPDAVLLRSTPRRVLFIGNSHTFINGGIDWHVGRMAESENPPRIFSGDAQTISGATLADHYELDSQGRIPYGEWDTVVIQGHIPRTEDPSAKSFMEHARLFDEVVRTHEARTVFFMSWPHADFRSVKLRDIIDAHRFISEELGADVAPVAIAMQRVKHERPDIKLLAEDGVHAGWPGSYLASAVIYATLFNESPEGLGYTFGVSDKDAAYLQRIAWEAVKRWNKES